VIFFDFVFWQNLVSTLLATILGVVFGIPVAFFIDRKITQWQEKNEITKQKNALIQRKKQLLQLLSETLQKNLKLVEQMENQVKPEYVIFYNVDTLLLESTSSIRYEIIDDLNLNRQIDSIRYELLHLHRKVELQLEIEYTVFKAMGNYMTTRTELIGAIIAHIPRVKQEISDTLSIIAAQI
jgi:hypothetical protein